MAITGTEFLRDFGTIWKKISSIGVCCICIKPITGVHSDDVRTINGKPVHEDCYFEDFGREIESHPIVMPHLVIPR
jgi:hypothetical protein